jgi:hypothetical protein
VHHVGKDLPVDKVCAVELIVVLESIGTDATKFHNLDRTPRASPKVSLVTKAMLLLAW